MNRRRSESLPSPAEAPDAPVARAPTRALLSFFGRAFSPRVPEEEEARDPAAWETSIRLFDSRPSYDGGPEDGGPLLTGDVGDDGVSGDDGRGGEWNGIAESYGVERGPLLKMELEEGPLAFSDADDRCGTDAYRPPPSPFRVRLGLFTCSPASPARGSRSAGGVSRPAVSEEKSASSSSGRGRSGRNSPPGSNSAPSETTRRRVGVPGALAREGERGDDEASSEARAGAAPALDRSRCDGGGDIPTPLTLARAECEEATTGHAEMIAHAKPTRTRHARRWGWTVPPSRKFRRPTRRRRVSPSGANRARARARLRRRVANRVTRLARFVSRKMTRRSRAKSRRDESASSPRPRKPARFHPILPEHA